MNVAVSITNRAGFYSMKNEYLFSVIFLILSGYILAGTINLKSLSVGDIILTLLMLLTGVIILINGLKELKIKQKENKFRIIRLYFLILSSGLFIITGVGSVLIEIINR